MNWLIFILALGYFGYNASRFWVDFEFFGAGPIKGFFILLFGCFIEAVENIKIVLNSKKKKL